MDITTSMGLLKFALLGIDLLAWPVLALCYPLFASIRAVETGSKYQLRKLVIYWTLFSLFSLFEFAFAKIIEWIPFWSSIRLIVIFWLVMPQFEGSCLAYQGLVRPVLLMELQAVIDRFYKLKDERLCKREMCLNGVEKYIKEYGSEALEKLLAMEHESQKCIDSQNDVKILEPEIESTAVTSKELNEPNAARPDTEMLEASEKSAATTTQQERVCYEQSIASARVLNGTYAVTNVMAMTLPEASAENKRPETPPQKKTQQGWTCDLCKVTTVSEAVLNAHLQGSKHKSKLDSLKASLLDAKDRRSSLSVQHSRPVSAAWDPKGTHAAAEVKGIMPPKETAEKRRLETPLLKKAQQEWTCDLCKVTTTGETTFNSCLHGHKHKSELETPLKASTHARSELVAEGPSPSATSKVNNGNVTEKLIKESGSELEKLIASKTGCEECSNSHIDVQVVESEEKNGSAASQQSIEVEVEEMTPPEASCAETLPLKKAQQEWSSDLCNVKATSEMTLKAHLHSSKHKFKLDSLKASLLDAKDTGPSLLQRQVQHTQSVSAAWYPKGTYAAAEVKEIIPPKETAEKRCPKTLPLKKALQEWTCDLCKVTTTSKQDLNAHLHGNKHKSTLETLKARTLGANHTGFSPSGMSKLNQGKVAEKFIKESGSGLEKLMASKTQTEREACSSSHRDVQVLESEEKKGSVASQQVQYVQSVKAVWVPKGTDANFEVREMMPPEESSAETPPLEKAQQEWSEKMLNADLQGGKHKPKFESLKTSKLPAEDTKLSPSAKCKANQVYLKHGEGSVKSSSQNKVFKRRCVVCDVKLLSDVDLASHLKGKLHASNIEKKGEA